MLVVVKCHQNNKFKQSWKWQHKIHFENSNKLNANISVLVSNETVEGWQDLLDHLDRRWRILVPAQVHNDPGDISEEWETDKRTDEVYEWFHNSQSNDIVSALRSISYNVKASFNFFHSEFYNFAQKKTHQ